MSNNIDNLLNQAIFQQDLNPAKAEKYASMIMQETSDTEIGKCKIALSILLKAQFKQAKYKKALAIFEQYKDSELLNNKDKTTLRILNQMGSIHYRLHNTTEAVKFYKKALDYAMTSDHNKNALSLIYNNLANSYLLVPDYNNALKYYLLASQLKANNPVTDEIILLSFVHFYNSVENNKLAYKYLNKCHPDKYNNLELKFVYQINNAKLHMNLKEFNEADKIIYNTLDAEGFDNPFWTSSLYLLLAENACLKNSSPQSVLNLANYSTMVIDVNKLRGGFYETVLKYRLTAMNKLGLYAEVENESAKYLNIAFNDARRIMQYDILKQNLLANFKLGKTENVAKTKKILDKLQKEIRQLNESKKQFSIIV